VAADAICLIMIFRKITEVDKNDRIGLLFSIIGHAGSFSKRLCCLSGYAIFGQKGIGQAEDKN